MLLAIERCLLCYERRRYLIAPTVCAVDSKFLEASYLQYFVGGGGTVDADVVGG